MNLNDQYAEYDFVIIGAGTAGCVLARRLTEDPAVSVIVLEAGADRLDDPRMNMPGGAGAMYDDEEFDWKFRSVPQKDLYGRVVHYPRGKTIGGSSAINQMSLLYPNRSCIDAWEALGNQDWSWDALAPYYRKFQKYNAPTPASQEALGIYYIKDENQGKTGPIQSSYPPTVGPLAKAWPETLKNLGWPITGDLMSGSSIGGFSGPYSVNPNGTVRSHAGNAYYAPIADRENVRMETGAQAEKIIFDTSSEIPIATGVQYIANGIQHTVCAMKEVILAAGVFQTPQLLELSGIGSKELLENLNILVVVDNPNVGENLQDHAMTGVCAQVREGVPTLDLRRDPAFLAEWMDMYAKDGTGPLTAGWPSFALLPLTGWASDTDLMKTVLKYSEAAPSTDTRPSRNAQSKALNNIVTSPSETSIQLCFGASQAHFDKEADGECFAVTEPENYAVILLSLPHPYSAGTCHIATADPKILPTVDPRFMSHPMDVEVLGRHLACLEKLFDTSPLADLIEPNGRRLPTSSPLFKATSEEEKLDAGKEHAKRYLRTTSHPVGTAAMLPLASGGVVDSKLNVYGVRRLRVVDASVFPMVVRGNIQSTVYAVAERAADFVKEKWSMAL